MFVIVCVEFVFVGFVVFVGGMIGCSFVELLGG